jgi:vacuolar iron transporter family protein
MGDAGPHEEHPKASLLSDFILGGQDGIVNVLGIVLGLAAAGSDLRLLLIAGLAALGAESVSMAAVAYTSTNARHDLYVSELNRERREMKEVPQIEREEIRTVFREWGYQGDLLEEMTDKICANPKAMLEFMMAFELKLAPISAEQALQSAEVVGVATVVGSSIPLIPFFVLGASIELSAIVAVILSGIALAGIGVYQARTTIGSLWKSGLQMLIIGLGAGFAGFLIGHFLGGVA